MAPLTLDGGLGKYRISADPYNFIVKQQGIGKESDKPYYYRKLEQLLNDYPDIRENVPDLLKALEAIRKETNRLGEACVSRFGLVEKGTSVPLTFHGSLGECRIRADRYEYAFEQRFTSKTTGKSYGREIGYFGKIEHLLNHYADILIRKKINSSDLLKEIAAIREECKRLGEACVSRFGFVEKGAKSK